MTTIAVRTKEAYDNGKLLADGHTIFNPTFYEPYFTAEELGALIQTHESDTSHPKTTIFGDDGSPIPYVRGIYNLSFLYWLAAKLDVTDFQDCLGRGSQANAIVTAILEKLEEK